MKASKLLLALGIAGTLISAAHAAPTNTVSKKITLTAQINDALYVSKPDGSTWYSTEELEPTNYTQSEFKKTLPVRVFSKNSEFNVSLGQQLKMSNGNYEMVSPTVTFGSAAGDKAVTFGAQQKITQSTKVGSDYDEVHDLNISVTAPTKVGTNSTNGSYSGDLVMIFEPVAASGG
ncbi:CS1 type fimbrial major subunit [Pseudomonas sp. P5_152]|uniref:CS1 type fimbrial major subunit n=1 Tax=Pseudomonas sp. P5_152 TaxID=3043442 RepID=UPI002A361760|nr:CS1 type fimbrial major subunit [Pseudomonas sp. P5_152]MDX9668006.1 CS1 type fimbrial major subunit [Pseudomonas sp. P5_152]